MFSGQRVLPGALFPDRTLSAHNIGRLIPLIFALEQRVVEANTDVAEADLATLNDYVESALINLITLRDIAKLESIASSFASTVQTWLTEIEA